MAKAPTQPLLVRILDAARIGENDDWEFKTAKGGLPASIWETYSAMSNAAGGTIVLGAAERNDAVHLDGVPADKVEAWKKSIWDQHNNRQAISHAAMNRGDIRSVEIDGRSLIAITVRPAERQDRPVYVGTNPFTGTYKRRYEGDYRFSPEEVRRMFADAADIPADARVLTGFSLVDLDPASLAGFCNRFASTSPDHPWLALDDTALLQQLGGWRRDRETGLEGLTLAGLLMFGKHHAIIDPAAAPAYMVDFRDYRGRRGPDDRWTDRLFPDGMWEANLFQFYQRCLPKLTADLKVPFRLEDGQRIDETKLHVALREALVNSLIHADYTVGAGIVIERHDHRYDMANPGTLLVSEAQLLQGGTSECRNRTLQRMFMRIGGSETAGSGFARIRDGWKSNHWRAPRLTQDGEQLDRIRLSMPMISLMPPEELDDLRQKIGQSFDLLGQSAQIALATAKLEDGVTNVRMQDLVVDHPADITKMLRDLVAKGLLEVDGQRRGARYHLPVAITSRQDLFSAAAFKGGSSSSPLPPNSPRTGGNSSPLPPKGEDLTPQGEDLTAKGEDLKAIAARVAGRGKVSPNEMRAVILALSKGRYLTLSELAGLLARKSDNLRNKTLTPMVRKGLLCFRHPNQPNHPDQAYTAATTAAEEIK